MNMVFHSSFKIMVIFCTLKHLVTIPPTFFALKKTGKNLLMLIKMIKKNKWKSINKSNTP